MLLKLLSRFRQVRRHEGKPVCFYCLKFHIYLYSAFHDTYYFKATLQNINSDLLSEVAVSM